MGLPCRRAVTAGAIFALLATASLPGAAAAASPDTWTAGAPLTDAPLLSGVAPLPDGRVVVAAGLSLVTDPTPIMTYSRATNGWTNTGYSSLYGGAVATTGAGDVVITGGVDLTAQTPTISKTAAVYRTSGGTFTARGSATMITPRIGAATAQLADGRILLVGGMVVTGAVCSSVEIFDGSKLSFSAAADSGVAWYLPQAVTLSNGKVLVAGGYGATNAPIATARLYDPLKNTWTAAGSMRSARAYFTLTPLPDGRVLAAGGVSTSGATSSAEVYDPATNAWTATAAMSVARTVHAAVRIGSGVLVAGGATAADESGQPDLTQGTASAELFDPYVGAWRPSAPMPQPLVYAHAVPGTTSTSAVILAGTNISGTDPFLSPTFIYQAPAAPTAYPATKYHPIAPGRVLDTRPTGSGNTNIGLTGKLTANTPRTFKVAGVVPTGQSKVAVPVGAKAVTGNLTVVNQSAAGSLVLGPVVTSRPSTSTLSFPVGDIRANNVTVALRSDGTLAIDFAGPAGATTNAVFDVTGYFLDASSDTTGSTLHTVTPGRVLDSRPTTTGVTNIGLQGKFKNRIARTFQVAGVKPVGGSVPLVPSNATAVTGNVTIVNNTSGGYVALGPTMANDPKTSTLNIPVGDIRANGVTVQLSAGKLAAVWAGTTGSTADVIFDVTGYFTADATGSKFYPIDPVRMLDSRVGNGLAGVFENRVPRTLQLGGRGMAPAQQVPTTASGIAGNLTLVNESSKGYAFISPAATSTPTSSTLNVPAGDARANGFDVALATGGKVGIVWAGTTGSSTHVILDVTGYWK